MRVAFVIDSSSSMLVLGDKAMTFFDMAISSVESFVKTRIKMNASGGDKYLLLLNGTPISDIFHPFGKFLQELANLRSKHNRYWLF